MIKNLQATIQLSFTDDWVKISIPVNLRELKHFRVNFKGGNPSPIYLDKLAVKSNSYLTNTLCLEKAKYKIKGKQILGDAEFGEVYKTLGDAVNEKVIAGELMLDLATR